MVRLVVLACMIAFLGGCSSTSLTTPPETENYSQYQVGTDHPAVIALFAQADREIQEGNWTVAMTYLDQARRIEPRNPYVLYRQAWVSAQSGDTERARQLLERSKVYADKDDELLNYRLYELEFQLQP